MAETRQRIKAVDITSEAFKPFGQVIQTSDDGKPYGPHDAQLDLSQGTPRFYIIKISGRMNFDQITFHSKVTQCLACASEVPWYLAVAAPNVKPSPKIEDIVAFRIPPKTMIMLARGCWHAGPLFPQSSLEFYNLELSDTNLVDHHNHYFETPFVIQEAV